MIETAERDNPVIAIIAALTSCIDKYPARAKIILAWITTHKGRNILGGQGIISAMSKETGLHRRTVLIHVQEISKHPILGKVLKYRQNK